MQAVQELKGVVVGKQLELSPQEKRNLSFPLKQLFLLVETKEFFTEDASLLSMLLSYSFLSPASHSLSLSALVRKKAVERKRSTQTVSRTVTNLQLFLAGSTAQLVSST